MCKFKSSTIRRSASVCISAFVGLSTFLLADQDALAQACDPGLGASLGYKGPYPAPNDIYIHAGQISTIENLRVQNIGTCVLTNLKSWLVSPDNTFQTVLNLDPATLGVGLSIVCPAGGSCLPFVTAFPVTLANVANPLSFSTNHPPGLSVSVSSAGVADTIRIQYVVASTGIGAPGALAAATPIRGLILLQPCVRITKECVRDCTPYGQPIEFRGVVNNCTPRNLAPGAIGDESTLFGVTVTDDPTATITFAATTSSGRPYDGNLLVGESISYSGSYQPAGSGAALCGPFSDTVTVVAADKTGFTVTNAASATCHVSKNPRITLTKDCQPRTITLGTGPQAYTETFVVCNTGNVPLSGVVINDSKVGPIAIGNLAVGQCVTNVQGPFTVSAADCPSVTDRATATGNNICPPDAVCPAPPTVSSAEVTCTVQIVCPPCVRITEEVVCVKPDTLCEAFTPDPNDQTSACGMRNESGTDCSAFCFKITVSAVCADGSPSPVPLENVVVTSKLGIANCLPNLPTTLMPGQVVSCIIPSVTLCTNFTDIVTVTAVSAVDHTTTVTDTDSVNVTIKPIAVRCVSTLDGGTFDLDTILDNCVTVAEGSADTPLRLTTTIYNDSDVDLNVTVANLPALVDCSDQVTPIVITQPIPIAARGTYVITGCVIADCTNVTYDITVRGTVNTNTPNSDCVCFYNRNGRPIMTDDNANDHCPVCIRCAPAVTCRVTGGGVLIPGTSDESCITVHTTIFPFTSPNGLTINKITHGGQLGAPFSQMDCGEILGNPCIRGQWQHTRHYEGTANPRDVIDMDFHSQTPKGQYDSLNCACLGCCDPVTGAFITPITVGGICNPDDHKVCGPQPRPAPANAIIWSGIGKVTPEDDFRGSRAAQAEWVIFRVYIEDRSEPGGFHPKGAVEPSDIYCFQAWKTGIKVSKKPDFTTIAPAFRSALGQANCQFLRDLLSGARPIGSLPDPTVNGLTADIQDCGPLHDGNHQIHPATGATCDQ